MLRQLNNKIPTEFLIKSQISRSLLANGSSTILRHNLTLTPITTLNNGKNLKVVQTRGLKDDASSNDTNDNSNDTENKISVNDMNSIPTEKILEREIPNNPEAHEAYDEDIDNPKPLPIFENMKKEGEQKRVKDYIYAFPVKRDDWFNGINQVKMKDVLLKELPTKSFKDRIITPKKNDVDLSHLPYIYNTNTLKQAELTIGAMLNDAVTPHVKLLPSQNSKIVLFSCPIKGSETYLKAIAKNTAKQLDADFLEISNKDIFYRISGNVMKHLPHLITSDSQSNNAMTVNKGMPGFSPDFHIKGTGPGALNHPITGKPAMNAPPMMDPNGNMFSTVFHHERKVNYDNSKKIPFPIFKQYLDSKGTPMTVINRNMPWPKRDSEINIFIQDLWVKLFSKITEETENKNIIIFYEDLLSLFAQSKLDPQDLYDGLVTVLGITSVFNNVVLIAPSTPTFAQKVTRKNDIRFGPVFEEVELPFKAPDIDEEPPAPRNNIFGPNAGMNENNVQTKPIEFTTILDKFVGVNVIPIFPSFQRENQFKEFREIIREDHRKIIRKYNIYELEMAAKSSNCVLPIEELEKMKTPSNGLYLEENLLTPNEAEKLLLLALGKVKSEPVASSMDSNDSATKEIKEDKLMKKIRESRNRKTLMTLNVNDIKDADRVLLNTLQSQQFLKDGLEYINIFKNPKDRFGLNKYENRILKECLVLPSQIKTNFNNIGGLKKTKHIMDELITLPLKRPELFKTGILKETTTGILLFGPPGTGKTLTARAVANQSGANFLNIQMSNIQSKWVGENEKNVKAIFSLARKLAPCVLFIDEIDALLQTRKGEFTPHYMVNTLNEFMQEWDGLVSENDGVIVIGATNRPFDLDEAVLRRLPRRIFVSLPDHNSRKEILDILLKEEIVGNDKKDRDEILDYVAGLTEKWSGSDLKNLCIATAMNAIKQQIIDKEAASGQVLRVLRREHFDMAISSGDIVPSLNDKTSILVQLQEWNSKYGTGADAGGYSGHSTVFGF